MSILPTDHGPADVTDRPTDSHGDCSADPGVVQFMECTSLGDKIQKVQIWPLCTRDEGFGSISTCMNIQNITSA